MLVYNLIYFDSNANNDLTDDPVVEGTINRQNDRDYVRVEFPAVDMKIEVDGVSLPYCFQPYIYAYNMGRIKGTAVSEQDLDRYIGRLQASGKLCQSQRGRDDVPHHLPRDFRGFKKKNAH